MDLSGLTLNLLVNITMITLIGSFIIAYADVFFFSPKRRAGCFK